tara:strand:+ start:1136 stop:1324 length:189 start_codon:yes stop_codon:yes gene_type:complete
MTKKVILNISNKLKCSEEKKCKIYSAINDIGGPGRKGRKEPIIPINNNKNTITSNMISICQK